MAPFKETRLVNIWSFLGVFCTCYCLVAITSSYLVTAIQSIERQFQIPSRMSGTLMSANRLGYLMTVVVLAYLGSKGNRARWIGGGCLTITFACLLIASPHFIFNRGSSSPVKESILFGHLTYEDVRAYREGLSGFTTNKTIRLPQNIINIQEVNGSQLRIEDRATNDLIVRDTMVAHESDAAVNVDAQLPDVASRKVRRSLSSELNDSRQAFLAMDPPSGELLLTDSEKSTLIKAASQSIGYCSQFVNEIKRALKDYKCSITEANTAALAIMFAGIFIIGIGNTMPHTLGIPLVDDHIKRGNTPLYFGGIIVIRILGPFTGYLLGGACSSLYFSLNAPQGLTPSDPRWVGAWWLGYVIVAAALFIPALLIFFFPIERIKLHTSPHQDSVRMSAVKNRIRKEDLVDQQQNGNHHAEPGQQNGLVKTKLEPETDAETENEAEDEVPEKKKPFSIVNEVSGFTTALCTILRSPIYTGALIGRLVDGFGGTGFRGFTPKYLDNHYGLAAHKSSTILAPINIASVISGIIFGSVVMHRFKLDGRRAVYFVLLSTITSATLSFIKSGLGCHSVVNRVGRLGSANNFNFSAPCNSNCGCEVVSLYPVCSRSGEIFYSPCHAGCTNMEYSKGKGLMNLTNCACADGGAVSRDWCEDDCQPMLFAYLALNVFGGIIGGISIIPSVMIGLRSVPHKYRSVALGFSGFVSNLFSSLPSTIVYGMIIDSACIQWGNNCGQPGSCEIYDPEKLRYRPHMFMAWTKLASIVFDIWVWYWAKDLVLLEKKRTTSTSTSEKYNPQKRRLTLEEIKEIQTAEAVLLERAISVQSVSEEDRVA